MPKGAFGGFAAPGLQFGAMNRPFLGLPPIQEQPKTSYRRSARKKARTSAPSYSAGPLDQASLANTRLKTAKNLIGQGKYEQARGWLTKVAEMDASAASVAEACRLACELDELAAKSGPLKKAERED
jgi:hypothetical protein